jgi:hypothetical protein
MTNHAEATAGLEKIFRQLEKINPSAARSLEGGLEETSTVHRLGISAVLRRKLATISSIASCLSTSPGKSRFLVLISPPSPQISLADGLNRAG